MNPNSTESRTHSDADGNVHRARRGHRYGSRGNGTFIDDDASLIGVLKDRLRRSFAFERAPESAL
jgi:hypothetical protein